MKITSIKIANFLGVGSAHIDCTAPITLIAGDNGSGKSSVAQAVRFAMTGAPARVSLKKDFGLLLKDGAKKGKISIEGDSFNQSVTLPDGKVDPVESLALPFLLDIEHFSRLNQKDAKKALFAMTNVKVTADIVLRMIKDRGITDEYCISEIMPLVRVGFPEAHKVAQTRATEDRGAWKATTGEVYGSQKAETWTADLVDIDEDERKRLLNTKSVTREHIETVSKELWGEQRAVADAERSLQLRQNLQAEVDKATPELRQALQTALEAKKQAMTEYHACKQAAGADPHPHFACISCGTLMFIDGCEVMPYDPPKADKAAKKRLPELEAAVTKQDYFIADRSKIVANADKAAEKLAAMDEAVEPAVSSEIISLLSGDLQELQELREKTDVALLEFDKREQANINASKATERALSYHHRIQAWTALAEAMGESGIPAELLASALTPINNRMAVSCVGLNWPLVRITPDITLEFDNRPYSLVSESEQWRTNVVLAEAISYLSGLRILCIDRFDVLDIPSRGNLIEWALYLTECKEIDTFILCGTLKQSSVITNEHIKSYWMVDGQAIPVDSKEEVEQAA